jgi:hypothetical protein
VSINSAELPAIAAVEPMDTAKSAIIPVVVFIVVQIMLAAETIWVIFREELNPWYPGAVPIAGLLSITLLADFALVCSVAATLAVQSIRQSQHVRGRELHAWSDVVQPIIERIDFGADDVDRLGFAELAAELGAGIRPVEHAH